MRQRDIYILIGGNRWIIEATTYRILQKNTIHYFDLLFYYLSHICDFANSLLSHKVGSIDAANKKSDHRKPPHTIYLHRLFQSWSHAQKIHVGKGPELAVEGIREI
jgi:hypothetical protein